MSSLSRLAVTVSILCLAASAYAETKDQSWAPDPDRPRGTYIEIDPGMADIAAPREANSNIIYLNGCFNPGDCTFSPGFENSMTNSSSIVNGTSTIPAFNAGLATWDAVVECVRATYSPFGVVVTEEDPGNVPHFEAVVAGRPEDIGMQQGVGGVAPFSCGVINNSITFSFANIYGGYVPQICWTVAQESAHSFGLDHEYLCEDPMTYLSNCGAEKVFQDVNAQCGEFSPRACRCSTNQNSVKKIRDEFGDGTPTPPEVTITEPAEGARVDPGYVVRADAIDDIAVERVELYINGQFVNSTTYTPYVFNAPTDMSDGVHRVEIRAVDSFDYVGITTINVVQGEPCGKASDCAGGETCVDGRCVAGPGTPGGLGEPCEGNGDCVSGLCGQDEGGNFCGEQCKVGSEGCPSGFGCLDTGDFGVCWPGYDDGGCGCRVGTPQGAAGTGLLVMIMFAGLAVIRRRRKDA